MSRPHYPSRESPTKWTFLGCRTSSIVTIAVRNLRGHFRGECAHNSFTRRPPAVLNHGLTPSPRRAVRPAGRDRRSRSRGGQRQIRSATSHGRLAPPFDAAERGGSPRTSRSRRRRGSEGASRDGDQNRPSSCQSMGTESEDKQRPRSGQVLIEPPRGHRCV